MILCRHALGCLSGRLVWQFFLRMFLCVESALLGIQAVQIAHIVLRASASHLDVGGIAGGCWHALDRCRYLPVLVAGHSVRWVARRPIRPDYSLNLLLFQVACRFGHRAALLTLVRPDLPEAPRLVPLIRAASVRHLLQLSSQSLRSGARTSDGVAQSSVLALLRQRPLRTLSSRARNHLRGGNDASARNRLLLTGLPDLLRVVQALILRIDCGRQRLAVHVSFLQIVSLSVLGLRDAIIRIDGLVVIHFKNVLLAV